MLFGISKESFPKLPNQLMSMTGVISEVVIGLNQKKINRSKIRRIKPKLEMKKKIMHRLTKVSISIPKKNQKMDVLWSTDKSFKYSSGFIENIP